MARDDWHVDVAEPLFLVADVSLLLEYAQLRPDGGIARIAGQFFHHLRGGGAAATEKDVHDLPFTAREDGVQRVGHRRSGDPVSTSGSAGEMSRRRPTYC